jgi:hypothetical protein
MNRLWLTAAAVLALATSARASEGEVVTHLAMFSLGAEGVHDELARDLGEAVRREVSTTPGHQLSEARVSLEQLSLVHDCDPEEASCLGKIAKQLGVSGFIFGKLSNEGGGAFAQLGLFDSASQSVKRSARAAFGVRDASSAEIDRKAKDLVAQLLGAPQPRASEPKTPSTLPDLVVPSSRADPAADSGGVSGKRVVGYALLGGAALSVGLSVFAFVEIDRAEKSQPLIEYRKAVGRADPAIEDVCDEAKGNNRYGLDARSFEEVKSECGAGRTYEVLQFIFLGAAAVSGGLSAYMFLSDGEATEKTPRALLDHFPIRPIVRLNSAEVRAKLRF